MEITLSPKLTELTTLDWLVLFVTSGDNPTLSAEIPDEVAAVVKRVATAGDLPKKSGETKQLLGLSESLPKRILLVGLGAADDVKSCEQERYRLFSIAARALCDQPKRQVAWVLPEVIGDQLDDSAQLELAAMALEAGVQSQAIYQQEPKKHPYQKVTLIGNSSDDENMIASGRAMGRAINLARDLINRTADEVTPVAFADRASAVANTVGVKCEIFDVAQLEAERMNSMLGVAKGSDEPPRMVKLEYQGNGDAPFIGLVGKGVTYDSGGLSIKPTDSMKTMKSDMSGAATVLAVMQAVAELKLPVNLRCYMGLAENMISGKSYRVGDVLTARNGTTIEVLNTDAEGRLVLADVLCYAVDEGTSKLIDFATLTGSCVVALGEDYTGVFTNNQEWCDQLMKSAEATGEKAWQMPMCDSFNDQLKSDIADCKNVGSRWGGAITAAKFLEKFVSDTPWIHCDIAGPAFRTDSKPEREGGASGVMIRSVVHLLKANAS